MTAPVPMSQAVADKLIRAYHKLGIVPHTHIDLHAGTIDIGPAGEDRVQKASDWKDRAPDRV